MERAWQHRRGLGRGTTPQIDGRLSMAGDASTRRWLLTPRVIEIAESAHLDRARGEGEHEHDGAAEPKRRRVGEWSAAEERHRLVGKEFT